MPQRPPPSHEGSALANGKTRELIRGVGQAVAQKNEEGHLCEQASKDEAKGNRCVKRKKTFELRRIHHKLGQAKDHFVRRKPRFAQDSFVIRAAELGNRIPMSTYHRKERAPFR